MTDPYRLRISAVRGPRGSANRSEWWLGVDLPWFRALPFSSIERLAVKVDGRGIDEDSLIVRTGWGSRRLRDLRDSDEYWGVQQTLHIGALGSGPTSPGAKVEVELVLRMPEGSTPEGWPRRVVKAAAHLDAYESVPWRLGVCSFSFAGEIRRGRSFRYCVERVAALGGYTGIELLGAQLLAGYPQPTADELERLSSSVREAGLAVASYGAFADPGRVPVASDEDLLRWATVAMDTAAALGSPSVRFNLPPQKELAKRVAEEAGTRDLTVLTELHATTPSDRFTHDVLEMLDDVASPNLGLVLDLSCVMRSLPRGFVDNILRNSLPDEAVEIIVSGWEASHSEQRIRQELGGLPDDVALAALPLLGRTLRLFRRSCPEWVPDVLPATKVVHAKYFEIGEDGDPAVPLTEVVDLLDRTGFDGDVLAEFEAHLWTEDPDTFGQLRAFRDITLRQTLPHSG